MGRDLDPGTRRYVELVEQLEAAETVPRNVGERRAQFAKRCRFFDGARPPGVRVSDGNIPGPAGAIPIRVYRPDRDASAATPGAVVFFHGGGWVVGDLDTHDRVAADLAAASGAVVIAVDYRLAPEHPYPAAFDDAYAVTAHVSAEPQRFGVDADHLLVAGESAGGNLAAAVALASRDRGGPRLRAQLLLYPCLDPDLSLPACRENAAGPLLTTAAMADYWKTYLGGASTTTDPYAAPCRARDLRGLAPAFIATAGCDPLRDDGRVYGDALREAGAAVEYREGARLVHGYLRARQISEDAAAEFAALAAAVRRFLPEFLPG